MAIFDPNGNEVASGETGSSNENISTPATMDGTYYIQVYVWSGSNDGPPTTGGALYDMVVYTN